MTAKQNGEKMTVKFSEEGMSKTDYSKEIERVIEILRDRRVKLKRGMSDKQIEQAEQMYGITFPEDLRAFYQAVVPVGERFYDWTDLSPENVWHIKKMMAHPIRISLWDIEANGWHYSSLWMPQWGERPKNFDKRRAIAAKHLRAAPKIIPIYGDNFLPEFPNEAGNPVFGFEMWCESHCHGETLWLYFEREWARKKRGPLTIIDYTIVKRIPHWYEAIERGGWPIHGWEPEGVENE